MTTTTSAQQSCDHDERDRGYARPVTAAVVLLPVVMAISSWTSTSTGGSETLLPSLAVEYTYRGEFAAVANASQLTSRCEALAPSMRAASRTDREEVLWLKERSGLTWAQLGKAFGVSRRAVHMWSSGGRLNESNARRLREFGAIVRQIEASTPNATPEAVRACLLAVEPDGISILDRLRRERSGGPTWGMPVGPEHLIDAIHEPVGQAGH